MLIRGDTSREISQDENGEYHIFCAPTENLCVVVVVVVVVYFNCKWVFIRWQ
jgi:hypothetical protein